MTDTAGRSRYRHLYGPVPSRRLGRSLGIDLVSHKVCTYDCIYCQIGKTTKGTWKRDEYVPKEEIIEEVKAFLNENPPPVDYFSLSGSGEPTLHSGIRWIIEEIKKLSSVPVAVITNGSLLCDEEVRRDLLRADVVLPSMDAVSPEAFEKINRPAPGFSAERMVEGLVEFRKVYRGQIWLEILFCKGVNDSPAELRKLKEAIGRIQPDQIHLNTVVRPPSEPWALPLHQDELEKIKTLLGEKAVIITEFDRHLLPATGPERREAILRILRRRPLSMNDVSRWLRLSEEELTEDLDLLIKEGEIVRRSFGNRVYYEISNRSERS